MDLTTFLVTNAIGIVFFWILNELFYWKRRGIPHVPMIPILGSRYVKLFFNGDTVTDSSLDIYSNFPDLKYFGMTVFSRRTVVLKDPEVIQDICITHFDHATDHDAFINEKMDPVLGRNVFNLKGDRWKKLRGAMSPAFTASKMKFIYELVSKVSEDFVQYLIDNPESAKMMEMKDSFNRYTNDVISTTAFGISVNSMKDRENDIFVMGKDCADLSGIRRVLKFLLGVTFPRTMRMLGLTFLTKKTNQTFLNMIRRTVEMRDEKKITRPDLIHLLIQARDSASFDITMEDIIAQSFIFYLAGFETSATVMTFVCHHLAYYPDVQEKLREEVDKVVSENGISYDSLSKLKYMEMVMNETMRLYPPIIVLDRVCVKPIKLPSTIPGRCDVTVDPGTVFSIPLYALHRDEKYFPSPNEFDPERFNDENKAKIPFIYAPFGIGPRKCIAKRFAHMQIKLLLCRLIEKFVIKPSAKSSRKIQIARHNLGMDTEHGTWLNFEPRVKIM